MKKFIVLFLCFKMIAFEGEFLDVHRNNDDLVGEFQQIMPIRSLVRGKSLHEVKELLKEDALHDSHDLIFQEFIRSNIFIPGENELCRRSKYVIYSELQKIKTIYDDKNQSGRVNGFVFQEKDVQFYYKHLKNLFIENLENGKKTRIISGSEDCTHKVLSLNNNCFVVIADASDTSYCSIFHFENKLFEDEVRLLVGVSKNERFFAFYKPNNESFESDNPKFGTLYIFDSLNIKLQQVELPSKLFSKPARAIGVNLNTYVCSVCMKLLLSSPSCDQFVYDNGDVRLNRLLIKRPFESNSKILDLGEEPSYLIDGCFLLKRKYQSLSCKKIGEAPRCKINMQVPKGYSVSLIDSYLFPHYFRAPSLGIGIGPLRPPSQGNGPRNFSRPSSLGIGIPQENVQLENFRSVGNNIYLGENFSVFVVKSTKINKSLFIRTSSNEYLVASDYFYVLDDKSLFYFDYDEDKFVLFFPLEGKKEYFEALDLYLSNIINELNISNSVKISYVEKPFVYKGKPFLVCKFILYAEGTKIRKYVLVDTKLKLICPLDDTLNLEKEGLPFLDEHNSDPWSMFPDMLGRFYLDESNKKVRTSDEPSTLEEALKNDA